MKKVLFSLALLGIIALAFAPPQAQAQNRYGASTFALDTLSGTDAMTFILPPTFGGEDVKDYATWQLRLTRIADTLTVNIYLEESIDDASSSPDYVVIDTIQASGTLSAAATELKYFFHAPIRGKKQRIRVTSTGSSASAQIEVDAWWRQKVPLMITDEH